MIMKYIYMAAGVLVLLTAVFFSGIQYEKAQTAKVLVKQLVKDEKSVTTINERSKDRDKQADTILRTVQAKEPIWVDQPLPADVLDGLRAAGIPTLPRTP